MKSNHSITKICYSHSFLVTFKDWYFCMIIIVILLCVNRTYLFMYSTYTFLSIPYLHFLIYHFDVQIVGITFHVTVRNPHNLNVPNYFVSFYPKLWVKSIFLPRIIKNITQNFTRTNWFVIIIFPCHEWVFTSISKIFSIGSALFI